MPKVIGLLVEVKMQVYLKAMEKKVIKRILKQSPLHPILSTWGTEWDLICLFCSLNSVSSSLLFLLSFLFPLSWFPFLFFFGFLKAKAVNSFKRLRKRENREAEQLCSLYLLCLKRMMDAVIFPVFPKKQRTWLLTYFTLMIMWVHAENVWLIQSKGVT